MGFPSVQKRNRNLYAIKFSCEMGDVIQWNFGSYLLIHFRLAYVEGCAIRIGPPFSCWGCPSTMLFGCLSHSSDLKANQEEQTISWT